MIRFLSFIDELLVNEMENDTTNFPRGIVGHVGIGRKTF